MYLNRQQWHSSPGRFVFIPLTGNVLAHCHSYKRDYSIKRYAIKRAIKAKSNTFGFWYSTFYSNKRVMQLSGMRISWLYCTHRLLKQQSHTHKNVTDTVKLTSSNQLTLSGQHCLTTAYCYS